MTKKKLWISFLFAALALSSGAAVLLISALVLNAPPAATPRDAPGVVAREDGGARVDVREGESAASVGRRLARAGLVKSALFWRLLARAQSQSPQDYLKAGSYLVTPPLNAWELYALLRRGEQELIAVTIPEGSTIKKTAALWERAGVCAADDFIAAASSKILPDGAGISAATPEGFLYPDTYYVPPVYPAEKLARLMADTFFKRLGEAGVDAAALSPRELYDGLILASIVEREYRRPDEAALIAGVFRNRLTIGMRLESCATVEYVITEIEGKPHPERLFERDLLIDSPYNTYRVRGLPPTPIASPGARALRAAFFPQPSDFLFFRLIDAGAGSHYFSRAFDEHIKAAALYVK